MSKAVYDNIDLFTKEFLNLNLDNISKELKDKGYFAFSNAINDNVISNIYQDATKHKINLNNNKITGVYA